jgi:hypothetical protein
MPDDEVTQPQPQRKIWVVQKPPKLGHFDMDALERLGEVSYIVPVAPNIHDNERIVEDYVRMLHVIQTAGPEDVFIPLGGSPISNWLFGAALYASGAESINTALYSRNMDDDGRRLDDGRYRIVNMITKFPDAPDEKEDEILGLGAEQ